MRKTARHINDTEILFLNQWLKNQEEEILHSLIYPLTSPLLLYNKWIDTVIDYLPTKSTGHVILEKNALDRDKKVEKLKKKLLLRLNACLKQILFFAEQL